MRSLHAVLGVTAICAIAGCGGSGAPSAATTATGVQGPSEVAAEPVNTPSKNPFTPAVGKDKGNVTPPKAAVNTGHPVSYQGSVPGLYGGTMDYSTCNATQLVNFLEATPDKAAAWARALGIQVSEIRTYVSGLTPVTLRVDTRVTNHGYINGIADPIQSVLQAGTAVFVDKYGQPVVKCYCGNPLGPPITYTQPTYTGPLWSGFEPTHITIIQQSTTIINVFKLYDPSSGQIFARPAGTDGTSDRPYSGPGGAATTPTTPTPTPTPTVPTAAVPPPAPTPAPATPSAPAGNPEAHFTPSQGTQADIYTLSVSGFQSGTMAVELTRPDGVHEHYTIEVGSDGTGSYTFPHNGHAPVGTYTAVITDPSNGTTATAQTTVSG
jgi:hypothetical protein